MNLFHEISEIVQDMKILFLKHPLVDTLPIGSDSQIMNLDDDSMITIEFDDE